MSLVETGIVKLLTATPAISALVGTKIYPVVLPNDFPLSDLPAVTYQTVSASTDMNLDRSVLETKRIDINVFAGRYLDAKSVHAAIAEVLAGFSGTLPNGVEILEIVPGVQVDDYSSNAQVYKSLTEYTVLYAGI
jgi:hypothetical protein